MLEVLSLQFQNFKIFKKDAQTIFVRQIHPQKESILTRLTDVEKAIKPTNNIVYHVVRKLRDALRWVKIHEGFFLEWMNILFSLFLISLTSVLSTNMKYFLPTICISSSSSSSYWCIILCWKRIPFCYFNGRYCYNLFFHFTFFIF